MSGSLLAQEFVVVARVPDYESFFHDPGMTVLRDGTIFAACPTWKLDREIHKNEDVENRCYLQVVTSSDGGKSWSQHDRLPYSEAIPFVVDGRLYMFVQPRMWNGIWLMRSDDNGRSWSAPVHLFEGRFWNCSTSMARVGSQIYWSLNLDDFTHMVALAGDTSKDLLQKDAWRLSKPARRPDTPSTMRSNNFPPEAKKLYRYWRYDNWLEPNVYVVGKKIRVATRSVIDEQSVANLCCLAEITDNGGDLRIDFERFYPWPGGQNKFFIMQDREDGMFWMLTNLVADSMDVQGNAATLTKSGYMGSPGNERRNLALFYGIDGLNWFPAGMVAQWPGMLQSFMYPSAAIQGDDIVLTSRTSHYARNQHDADLTTFHRIKNFRSLALNIRPEGDALSRVLPPKEKPLDASEQSVLGRWMWQDGQNFSCAPGGTVQSGAGSGRWKLREGGIEFDFDLWKGKLHIASDGTILEGKSPTGEDVWAVRQPVSQ